MGAYKKVFVQIDRACAAARVWHTRNGEIVLLHCPASVRTGVRPVVCATKRWGAISRDHQVRQNGNSG
jgi:hypothetical protein